MLRLSLNLPCRPTVLIDPMNPTLRMAATPADANCPTTIRPPRAADPGVRLPAARDAFAFGRAFCWMQPLAVSLVMFVAGVVSTANTAARAESLGGEPMRFWAVGFDGRPFSAAALDGPWWDVSSRLAGRPMFDAQRPIRCVYDASRRPRPPAAFVVLANGDRLPGRIVRYQGATSDDEWPSRFLVMPEPPALSAEPSGIWIRADQVLRIVAAATDMPAETPGQIVTLDGRAISANAIRWSDRGLRALTDSGVIALSLDQVAALAVPKVDRTTAVWADGEFASLMASSRVARAETEGGAVITWLRGVEQVVHQTVSRRTRQGVVRETTTSLAVRPRWAISGVLIPADSLVSLSMRRAEELPLSLLPAVLVEQETGIYEWPWRANRGARGGALRVGPLWADLGLGMHSRQVLAFDLPSGAKAFEGWVGLDADVCPSACAGWVVSVVPHGQTAPVVKARGVLRGGQPAGRVGPIDLTDADRLVLAAEFGDDTQEADAAPWDIGDHVNWLFPTITVEQGGAVAASTSLTSTANGRANNGVNGGATAASSRVGVPGSREALLRWLTPGWEFWTPEFSRPDVAAAARFDEAMNCWTSVLRRKISDRIVLRRRVEVRPLCGDVLEAIVAADGFDQREQFQLVVEGQSFEPSDARLITLGPQRKHRRVQSGSPAPPTAKCMFLRWDLQQWAGRAIELELVAVSPNDRPQQWYGLRFTGPVDEPLEPPLPQPLAALSDVKPTSVKSARDGLTPQANRLHRSSKSNLSIRLRGRLFERGFVFAAGSEATFELDPSWRRFTGLVGCCVDAVGPVQVLVDGEIVHEIAQLDELSPAAPIDIRLPDGARSLTLRVLGGTTGYSAAAFVDSGFSAE